MLDAPAVITKEVPGTFMSDLNVSFKFTVRIKFLRTSCNLACNRWIGMNFQMTSQVQRTIKKISANLTSLILDSVTFNVHLHVFDVEEAFATQVAQMIFNLFMHGFDVNVELRFLVKILAALNTQENFFSRFLVHRQNVRLQGVFSGCEEVAIR